VSCGNVDTFHYGASCGNVDYGASCGNVDTFHYGVRRGNVDTFHYGVRRGNVDTFHYGASCGNVDTFHYGVSCGNVDTFHYGVSAGAAVGKRSTVSRSGVSINDQPCKMPERSLRLERTISCQTPLMLFPLNADRLFSRLNSAEG
jgi:hypothetical protein